LIVEDSFYTGAKTLRDVFDQKMGTKDMAENERFVWDYWYHENKYVHFRTPAMHFFGEDLFSDFANYLVEWGQKTLGCNSITAPWLSYYTDGCKQELHGDIPHGPWAYVFSITLNPELFEGGDTVLLKDKIMNYWKHSGDFDGLNHEDIFESIRPEFNRLTVFDGRIPHGVSRVDGSKDPLKARIVLHGWFTEPCPNVFGSLDPEKASESINEVFDLIEPDLATLPSLSGTLSTRIALNEDGSVDSVRKLMSSLQCRELSEQNISEKVLEILKTKLKTFRFEKNDGNSYITLPIVFS